MNKFYQQANLLATKCISRLLLSCLTVLLLNFSIQAQCPPNIDFEQGNFNAWQCYSGGGFTGGVPNPPTVAGPIPNRHDMKANPPGNGLDLYGQFPQNCPNGSGHSIRIGDQNTGQFMDGVSYIFTIPAGSDKFNLTYFYALVLNQGAVSSHNSLTQPAFRVKLYNLTDGGEGPCPLDSMTANSQLPGFELSNTPHNGSVFFKPWAAANINLDGLAGKTIQIKFLVNGCGLGGGTHFGYAYVDIASECSSAFSGAVFCPDDTQVTVSAPFGYASYQWWDGTHTTPIAGATSQSLTLNPPPLAGDSITVDVLPYSGYGCASTFKAYLWDTLTVHSNAGVDKETCDGTPVQIGMLPEPNRIYKWTPTTGLSDPNISNPIATPSATTTYTLTVTTGGGGCTTPDVVKVTVKQLSDNIVLDGVDTYCRGSGQHATLILTPMDADSIQWYQDNLPIPGPLGHGAQLTVTQTGAYYAKLFSFAGCDRTTIVKQINIYDQPTAGFTTNQITQCASGNQFVFTNTSTIAAGALQYAWDLGDNTTATTADINHTYATEGTYPVKMIVTGVGGCKDTKSIDVKVNPSPTASFAVDKTEQCFKNNLFTFSNGSTISSGTMDYTWDFGDASFDNTKDVTHHYAQAGTYQVKLNAKETAGGCADDSIFTVIVHQSPITAFAINNDIQCFPGHQFVFTNNTTILSDPLLYTWFLGDGSVAQTTQDVNYSYAKAGNYTVTMTAATSFGCKDTTVHPVVVHAVPLADFTVRSVCENVEVPVINRTYNNTTSTVNYLWDFGNGHLDNIKTPSYSYPAPGVYPITLSVSTVECPVSFDTKTINVTIDAAAPGVRYPDKDAAFNFPEPLTARPIGNSVTWAPPTSLSNRFSYTPTFTGLVPQLYTITLRTATGCVTVDTQLVKTHKKIEIYVPTGFTVNGDGLNDHLRPLLIGFVKVNYFRIYNRWGKLLFTQNSDLPGWDGKVNNKPAETQTVVWMIEAVDVDGVVHRQQGTTILLR